MGAWDLKISVVVYKEVSLSCQYMGKNSSIPYGMKYGFKITDVL